VVGTHFPEDRDLFESALQRMREAFEAVRDDRRASGAAEQEFLAGYDTVRDIASTFFLAQQTTAARDRWAPDQLRQRE
jgi:hypothetical protein